MNAQLKLGEIITQIRGVSYKPSDVRAADDPDAVALLRANNIQEDGLNFDDLVWVDKHKVSAEQYLRMGDILICSSSGSKGLVGKAAIVTNGLSCAFGAFCKVVRTKAEYASYLGQFFRSPRYRKEISASAAGANINNIRNEHIDDMFISMPSENERAGCVAKLGQIDYLIQKSNNQTHQLDQLVKSRFIELFESSELSDETTIEAITEQVKVGFVGTCEKYYTDESGVPMLRTGNITEKGIDLKDLKYVTREFHEKNKKSQIHTGDLLIARHGSNGQANVYFGPEAQCLNAVVIVPNQSIASSIFLAGLINSPMVKEQIERTLVGSTQRVVNTKSIANLKVKVPSIMIQRQYEEFVEQTDKSKLAVKQSLEKLETLKKSLMQQYFG